MEITEDNRSILTTDNLYARLDVLGIAHTTIDHPPLFTVEQSKRLRGQLSGAHVKNLFLRNKKGKMWLLTCLEDRKVDLKVLRRYLETNSLSFCSAERLLHYLGVIPGAVSPFAVINDRNSEVRILLDRTLLEIEPLNFHPLDNAKTTSITPEGFMKFLEATNHSPHLLDFSLLG